MARTWGVVLMLSALMVVWVAVAFKLTSLNVIYQRPAAHFQLRTLDLVVQNSA